MLSFIDVSWVFIFISQMKNFIYGMRTILCWSLTLCGYKRYYIRSKDTKNLILKNIRKQYKLFCNKLDENGEPVGMCFHISFLPKFMINYEDYDGYYIFCSSSFFDNVIQIDYEKTEIKLDKNYIPEGDPEENENDDEVKSITDSMRYIVKRGDYGYFQYNTRKINLLQSKNNCELRFFAYQEKLFQNIMNFYKTNNYCKVFLSGEPGCGKTYFSYMMAQKLGCYLCDSFDPYEPSSNFNEIYSLVKISARCPLILLIDEVDILIGKIHDKQTVEHKKFSREIFDKTSYNNFMDKIEFGLYPNVILIMNSNKSKRMIDRMDSTYLRNGRINVIDEW